MNQEASSMTVALTNASVTLGEQLILADITFTLPCQCVTSLVGVNGSGKTTLLRAMAGLLPLKTGILTYFGRPASSFSARERGQLVAVVPQSIPHVPELRASEFLQLSRYAYRSRLAFSFAHESAAVEEAIALMELGPLVSVPMNQMSRGELQRVLIAGALAQEPRILILDEPLTALDPAAQDTVMRLLVTLKNERQLAIIASTHDMNTGVISADQVIALRAGACVFQGVPSEFMQQRVLHMVYGKEFLMVPHPHAPLSMVIPEVLYR